MDEIWEQRHAETLGCFEKQQLQKKNIAKAIIPRMKGRPRCLAYFGVTCSRAVRGRSGKVASAT